MSQMILLENITSGSHYEKVVGFIAKGCGKVMKDRKKVTKMY
jgi:hypothetical protein